MNKDFGTNFLFVQGKYLVCIKYHIGKRNKNSVKKVN